MKTSNEVINDMDEGHVKFKLTLSQLSPVWIIKLWIAMLGVFIRDLMNYVKYFDMIRNPLDAFMSIHK